MRRTLNEKTLRRLTTAVFFGSLILVGLLLHRGYGIGWDEPADRESGFISLRYVAKILAPSVLEQGHFTNLPELATYQEADHGVAFQLPMAVMEIIFFRHDIQGAYWMRHLLCFAVFVLGVWAVYRLGTERFGSWRWGLVGAALLVLSPRIFGEAFYNHKDVVFMSLFALGVFTLLQFLRRPSLRWALVHALVTALAVDVRIMGLYLGALTGVAMLLEMRARPLRRPAILRTFSVYVLTAGLLVVLFWPYLWEAPVQRLWACFRSFRHFRMDIPVFYLGKMLTSEHLPWHYLSVWLLVTTPVVYTVLFVGGAGAVLTKLFRTPAALLGRVAGRRDLLFGAWFLGPLVIIVAVNSVVYDGWRHVYFIYPAFLLLAVRGLRMGVLAWRATAPSSAGRRLGLAAGTLLVLGTGHTAIRQAAEYPYQYAYFSFLPGPAAGQLFERDYWGISGINGLEWLLAHDRRAPIAISDTSYCESLVGNNLLLLSPAGRARVRLVHHSQARYFFGFYRWHPAPYDASYGTPIHEIRAGGLPILTVFRRRD